MGEVVREVNAKNHGKGSSSGDLIDDELGVFREGRRCVSQIFALIQICEKALEKNADCMWVLQIWRSKIELGKFCG